MQPKAADASAEIVCKGECCTGREGRLHAAKAIWRKPTAPSAVLVPGARTTRWPPAGLPAPFPAHAMGKFFSAGAGVQCQRRCVQVGADQQKGLARRSLCEMKPRVTARLESNMGGSRYTQMACFNGAGRFCFPVAPAAGAVVPPLPSDRWSVPPDADRHRMWLPAARCGVPLPGWCW